MFEHMEYVEKETGSSFSNDCATCKLNVDLITREEQLEISQSQDGQEDAPCLATANVVVTSNTSNCRVSEDKTKAVGVRKNYKKCAK
jgi:high-affinity K+ transport system ATPase subunit B